MKKFFALLLAALTVLTFAACGKTETPETTAAPVAETAGKLTIAFGAVVEIVYDETGKLISLNGINETGEKIAAGCTGFEGRDVVHCVRSLLRYAVDNQLLGDAKTMSVRMHKDNKIPDEEFLPTIIQDTQYLADEECTGIRMVSVALEDLDENGNIGLEKAKHMAMVYLGATMTADLGGDEEPADGAYTFEYEGVSCTVNAVTGLVTAA